MNYRAEWHPGDGAPFLGPERFVKKIAKEPVPPSSSRRATLRDLLKSVAAKSGLSAEILLHKSRLGSVVNARDRFIREAVLQQGYLASQVASFLNYPSIQYQPCAAKKLMDLGKSVTSGFLEAQLHTLGDFRKKRKIRSGAVIGGAKGIMGARPDFQHAIALISSVLISSRRSAVLTSRMGFLAAISSFCSPPVSLGTDSGKCPTTFRLRWHCLGLDPIAAAAAAVNRISCERCRDRIDRDLLF